MMVGTRRNKRKVMKGLCILLSDAISRFWGFPIGLATLPIVIAMHKARSSTLGRMPCFFASNRTTGVPMIARVSFIRMADASPMPKRISSRRWLSFFALLNNL